MDIREQVLLKEYSTFHIGGPAQFFIDVQNLSELREALEFARARELRVHILGGGSNTLFSDNGFDGVIIRICILGYRFEDQNNSALLVTSAGESWDEMVALCVARGLWGIENLSSIPGTVGGAVVQNIGAYGSVLSECIDWVEVLDTTDNTLQTLSREACLFGYRDSVFKKQEGRYVVLGAALRLSKDPVVNITYRDLAEYFKHRIPTIAEIRDAVIEIRKNKFPDLRTAGTAGSFFKNPIVSSEVASRLALQYPGLPLFSLPESSGVKVPLAWFLDVRNNAISLPQNYVGGARLFEKQPLVIATDASATAHDVVLLADMVQKEIKKMCNMIVEPEVKII